MLSKSSGRRAGIPVIVRDLAALMFLVRKKPRTVSELVDLTGLTEVKVSRSLHALVEEGILARSEVRISHLVRGERPPYRNCNARAGHVYSWVEDETAPLAEGQC